MKGTLRSTSDNKMYGFVTSSSATRSASFSGSSSFSNKSMAVINKHLQMNSTHPGPRHASTPVCSRSASPDSRSLRRHGSMSAVTMTPLPGPPVRSSSPISSGYDSEEDSLAYAISPVPLSPVPWCQPGLPTATITPVRPKTPCCSHCKQSHSRCQHRTGFNVNETYLSPVSVSPSDGGYDATPSTRKLLNSSRVSTDSGVFSMYSDDSVLSSRSFDEDEPVYETIPDVTAPVVPSVDEPVVPDISEPEYATIDEASCDPEPVTEVAPPLPARNYTPRASLYKNTPHPSYKNYKGRVRSPPAPHLDDIVKETDIVDMSSYHVYTVKDVLESIQRLSETLTEPEADDEIASISEHHTDSRTETTLTDSHLRRYPTQLDIPSVIPHRNSRSTVRPPVPDTRWPAKTLEDQCCPPEYIIESSCDPVSARWDDSILAVEGTLC